ncbi:hypothetical protein PV721_35025 [Streptomyces sp. MB09-01]|nr:hypothetical protein [Streptomyces sp. MB09-01]MDX3539447.1 hypothetical protein [Streptomyces sp. MB09-01]
MLNGAPWADGISYYEVGRLEKLLHISCRIVTAPVLRREATP